MSEEIWKDVKDYEGLYQVSNLGRVKSLDREVAVKNGFVRVAKGKIKVPRSTRDGYLMLTLHNGGDRETTEVHRLVCQAFCGEKPDEANVDCMHLDGDPVNNKASNLRWGSKKCNAAFRIEHGTYLYGENHPCSKLKGKDVIKIDSLLKDGVKVSEISRKFNYSYSVVYSIKIGRTWSHLTGRGQHA